MRRSLGILLLCATSACSASHDSQAPVAAEAVGSIGLSLRTSRGAQIDVFTYSLTGPGGFLREGTVDVGGASELSALIGAIPVGTGYRISLRAAARDGSFECTGSAVFSIVGRSTTAVTINLQCREQPITGSVLVDGKLNHCPLVDGISASPRSARVGEQLVLSGDAHDSDGGPGPLSYAWTASGGSLRHAGQEAPSLVCTVAGEVLVTLKVSDGDCDDTLSAVVSCTADHGGGVARVVINEVESNGGVPGDWVELYNAGTAVADISGFQLKDSDDAHAFFIVPPGTRIGPGAFYVLEEADFGFGLGGADAARLWDAAGNPVDSYAWSAHATSTWGRCPNGSGAFVQTRSSKEADNDCDGSGGEGGAGGTGGGGSGGSAGGGTGGVGALAWPGASEVVAVDTANKFGTNLSGLSYQPEAGGAQAVLWAVQNGPSKLYRLLFDGTNWVPDGGIWSGGRLLHYLDGTGAPDTEGITQAEPESPAMYVATERDNDDNQLSKLVILRVDTSTPSGDLLTTNEWNLTADLPAVGPNLGLEAITFVPDDALVAGGFVDASTSAPYQPARYGDHAGGVFFVGVEATGLVYGYVLEHATGGFTRVASFSSGQSGIMDLAYDRELGYLWGYCDNTCGNTATIFQLTSGAFRISRVHAPPASLPATNNEGIAFAPSSECSSGERAFFWSDDNQLGGHALRRGSLPCSSWF